MKIRMFVSIPIKGPEALDPVLGNLKRINNVRASPLDQMHITLRFIGDIDDRKTAKVSGCIRDAVSGIDPFTVTVKGAGCFPNVKRPSVVWIGAEPESILTGIAERLSDNLRAANISFDEKPFKSHVTVGRCKGPADITHFLEENSDKVFQTFTCDEILVMRSELSPSGAKHTVLDRVRLGTQH